MAGSVSGAHSHALTKKTIHVWFDVGIQLLPNSDHNTMCYSITFPVTIDWIEGADDNLGRANAVLDPMIPAFKGKCERESGGRRTESGGEWLADAFSGWSQRPPLRKDDVEVQMP
jgi:hypothetical protein